MLSCLDPGPEKQLDSSMYRDETNEGNRGTRESEGIGTGDPRYVTKEGQGCVRGRGATGNQQCQRC